MKLAIHCRCMLQLLLLSLLILVSCDNKVSQQNTTEMTMSPNVPLQTTTATQISKEYLPTYQAKMTLWAEPSITSIPLTSTPTISIEIKETNIAEVIDQNFDCQFPCLFGVEPGVTNWENAANYFSQHSQFIQEDEYRSTFYFENMGIVFHIENESGLVGSITYLAGPINIFDLMMTYGKPEEIWISTKLGAFTSGPIDMTLVLFYGEQNFLAFFDYIATIQEQSRSFKVCYETLASDAESDMVFMWPKNQTKNFEEAKQNSDRDPDQEYHYQQIQDVSSTNSNEFYKAILDAKTDYCIDTSASYWP